MTWIKICGVTSPSDAELVASSRPSAIGLNFYSRSPRFVSNNVASSIRAAIPDPIEVIGVFVNMHVAAIARAVEVVGLTGVQLHGDESPQQLLAVRQQLPHTVLCRAFRIGAAGLRTVHDYLAHCRRLDCLPDRILVDARVPGLYGGSGQRIDWTLVAPSNRANDWPPMILAGGLHPKNVAEAIGVARPWGVDVASGVENESGEKDPQLTQEFARTVERFDAED